MRFMAMMRLVAEPELHQICPVFTGEVLPGGMLPTIKYAGVTFLASKAAVVR